jgi:hypothetical protein
MSAYSVILLHFQIQNNKWVKNFRYFINKKEVKFVICEKVPEVNWFDGSGYTVYDVQGNEIEKYFIDTCRTISSVDHEGFVHSLNSKIYRFVKLIFTLDQSSYIVQDSSGKYLILNKNYLDKYNIKKLFHHYENYMVMDCTQNLLKILK